MEGRQTRCIRPTFKVAHFSIVIGWTCAPLKVTISYASFASHFVFDRYYFHFLDYPFPLRPEFVFDRLEGPETLFSKNTSPGIFYACAYLDGGWCNGRLALEDVFHDTSLLSLLLDRGRNGSLCHLLLLLTFL